MMSLKTHVIMLVAAVTCEAGKYSIRRKTETRQKGNFAVKKLLGDSKPILDCRTLKIPTLERMPVISEPIYEPIYGGLSERKLVHKLMPSERHFIPESRVHRRIRIRSMATAEIFRVRMFGKSIDQGVHSRIGNFIRNTRTKKNRNVRVLRIIQ